MSQGPRERLIAAAIGLVQENGVAGAGLTELLERSSTARRSLYQHFPGGKSELIGASTREAGRHAEAAVRELGAATDPAGVLTAIVDVVAEHLRATDFRDGCPIAAAAAAPADETDVIAAAGSAFGAWIDALEALLVGEGHTADEARSLAGFVVSSVEGARLLARATRSTEPLEQARTHLEALLRAAAPGAAAASPTA